MLCTVELLEHILDYLSPVDILAAYGVNRVLYDTIEGYVTLQHRLELTPDLDSHYYVPAEELIPKTRGVHTSDSVSLLKWSYDIAMETATSKTMIGIDSTLIDGAEVQIPRLDSGCANMLMSQPPPKEVYIYIHCCARPRQCIN